MTSGHSYENIVMGLDGAPGEKQLLARAAYLCKVLQAKKVSFVHVAPDLSFPEALAEYESQLIPTDESLLQSFEKTVGEAFSELDTPWRVEIREGDTTLQILRFLQIKKPDLLLMGLKSDTASSGLSVKRLSEQATCDMLILPDHRQVALERILLGTDFSRHSLSALKRSVALARCTGGKFAGLHLYHSLRGFMHTGESNRELARDLRKHSEAEWSKLLQSLGQSTDIPLILREAGGQSAAQFLREAEEWEADLIVLGSKGHSASAQILLGSFTAKLVAHNAQLPLLIVKEAGENKSFVEALFALD